MQIIDKGEKYLKALNVIIIVGGVITAVSAGYSFYMSSIWRPVIKVLSVNYKERVAQLMIGKKQETLYDHTILSAGGQWGVQFNSSQPDGTPDRVELVKNGLVYEIYT